ncbi:MAG: DNA mismatch repair protein MutS [Mesorhizobium sp.]
MKTLLMHPDRDFDAGVPRTRETGDTVQDLELGVLLDAMAKGNAQLREVAQAALLGAWENDMDTILHRQDILKDCLANADVVRQFHELSLEPFNRKRDRLYSPFGNDPSMKVSTSVRTLSVCLDVLRRLRNTCNTYYKGFSSAGFTRFFKTLNDNLGDDYLAAATADLERLTFKDGVLMSAELGEGGKGIGFMLRQPQDRDRHMIRRLLTPAPASFTMQLHPRDEVGARALSELQDRGLGLVSDALTESANHVFGFLKMLGAELAFYIGCLNLHEELARIGGPVSIPDPSAEPLAFSCRDLRDACLALAMRQEVVGNDIDADGRQLVIITGANRGGKSTFLRSVGLAQLMMQCGMFVTARAFSASLRTGLFTHYKREEDRSMRSGKFDEELVRMDDIAGRIRSRAMMLFNESFAATNEREGSEIARQIVSALVDRGIMVFFVSHMYEFAHVFFDDRSVKALFLRADRAEDGNRSFRLHEERPLPTSYGADLYRDIFGPEPGTQAQAGGRPAPAYPGPSSPPSPIGPR